MVRPKPITATIFVVGGLRRATSGRWLLDWPSLGQQADPTGSREAEEKKQKEEEDRKEVDVDE